MGIWNWLFGEDVAPAIADINPATGLPLVGDIGGVDVAGNPYGVALDCPHNRRLLRCWFVS